MHVRALQGPPVVLGYPWEQNEEGKGTSLCILPLLGQRTLGKEMEGCFSAHLGGTLGVSNSCVMKVTLFFLCSDVSQESVLSSHCAMHFHP